MNFEVHVPVMSFLARQAVKIVGTGGQSESTRPIRLSEVLQAALGSDLLLLGGL